MKSVESLAAGRKPVVQKYERYGLFGGLAIGLVVGVLLSGPHFFEWSAGLSLAVILGCAVVSAGIGWFAPAISVGSLAGGESSSGDASGGDSAATGGGDGGV